MSRLIIASRQLVVKRCFSMSLCRFDAAPPQLDDAERVPSQKVQDLAEAVVGLTLQEAADLNTLLKKRLNISEVQFAAPAGGAAPAAAAPVEAAPVEEEPEPVKIQTEFTLTMTDFDAKKKVKIIKAIKANMPDMNLVASKKFIEALPQTVRKDVPKEEAETVMAALVAEGAVITMK